MSFMRTLASYCYLKFTHNSQISIGYHNNYTIQMQELNDKLICHHRYINLSVHILSNIDEHNM